MSTLTPAAREPKPRMVIPHRARGTLISIAGLIVGAGVWELIGRHTQQSSFAPFSKTIRVLWGMTKSGELPRAAESSLELFGAGLAIALVLGFFFGLLLARMRLLRIGLEPYILMLYATPMFALIPYILSLFGFEFRAKVIVVALFGIWPILINTMEGARSVNPDLLEVAKSYHSTEPKLWRHVIIPYTLPYTMTGARQGIARSLIAVIASEFLLAATGLGNLILTYTNRFDAARVLAAVLVITLLATLLMAIGRAIENYFARWKAGV
ncbi:MAG TPA: ABC transporter permease [Casimicrobiaceae bacterium]|nr:ABC transporter permease [Casimicrobiaceae bacterium]